MPSFYSVDCSRANFTLDVIFMQCFIQLIFESIQILNKHVENLLKRKSYPCKRLGKCNRVNPGKWKAKLVDFPSYFT